MASTERMFDLSLRRKYVDILQETQKRIMHLEAEIAKNKKLAAALVAMLTSSEERDISKERAGSNRLNRTPGYLKDNSVRLLRLIELEGKRIDAISKGLREAGIPMNEASLRARLSYYKKTFGFIDSPRPGFHRLSEKGKNYLNRRYPRMEELVVKEGERTPS